MTHFREPIEVHDSTFLKLWMFPIADMKGPISTGAAGMYNYWWSHGTTTVGILGALKLRRMLRAFPEENYPSAGFYCMCANDESNILLTVEKAWTLGKNASNILIGGTATHTEPQGKASGVYNEQKACEQKGAAHGKDRWCIKPKLAKVTALWLIEDKEVATSPTPDEDHDSDDP